MANITRRGTTFSVESWEEMSWKEAHDLVHTIRQLLLERGDCGAIRHDASLLSAELTGPTGLNNETRKNIRRLTQRFNELKLDPIPKPKPTPTPKPNSSTLTLRVRMEGLEGRVSDLEDRVSGHDNRHKRAEKNLKVLNSAVGVIENPDGTWLPAPDGQFARNAKMQEYLGYSRDKDGTVSFADRANRESPIVWWPTIVALVVALVLFFAILAIGGGAVWASMAMGLALVVATGAFVLTNRNDRPAR